MQFQSRPVEGIISAIGRSNRKNVEDLKSCLERGPKPALFRFSKKLSLARLKRAIERVSCFYLARSRWHKFSQRRSIHFFFFYHADQRMIFQSKSSMLRDKGNMKFDFSTRISLPALLHFDIYLSWKRMSLNF